MFYYLRNKKQLDALPFVIYFNSYPLYVSNRLTVRHQEAVYCMYMQWLLKEIKKENVSGWFLLRKYITMNGSYNVKCSTVFNCYVRFILIWNSVMFLLIKIISIRRYWILWNIWIYWKGDFVSMVRNLDWVKGEY